jgi:F-type H+-transporting ATPase subunit delta
VSVADTYADALYESARDKDAVAAVRSDLSDFVATVDGSPEFAAVLANPEIETKAKKAAVGALVKDATPLMGNFLQVLIDRGRIDELPSVSAAFEARVTAAEGRIEVQAVTAVPLDDDLRGKLIARIESQTGLSALLTEEVDPTIVGGLVLRVGGMVLDASLREGLAGMRRTLSRAAIDSAVAPATAT